jgi:outer membrane immunogenic protein
MLRSSDDKRRSCLPRGGAALARSLLGAAAGAALLGLGLGLGLSAPAMAADVYGAPIEEPYVPPPAPPAWSWTGIYFGGGGGYDWASFNISHATFFNGVEVTDFDPPRLYDVQIDPSAWFGTVTVGGDWQAGSNFVLGLFGSYDFQSKDDSFDNPIAFVGDPTNDFEGQSWDVHLGNVGTVAARAGFLPGPSLLLYGLVGYSWGAASVGYFEGCTPNDCSNQEYTTSGTVGGVTFGGGFEWMLTHMVSTRLEYRYTDFGTFAAAGNDGIIGGFSGTDSADIIDQSVRGVVTVRLGG